MGPDYEKIASLLSSNNIFNSVSELHGIVTGQVCSGAKAIKVQLTQQLLGVEENFPALIEQLIGRLGKDIDEQIGAGEFAFQPLLPDDEEELGTRLHALAQWCEGFNIGFGGSFGKGDQSILEDTREVLKDFVAISELDDSPEDDQENDESEENYMELVEYVRMAASTVYMQNNSDDVNSGNNIGLGSDIGKAQDERNLH